MMRRRIRALAAALLLAAALSGCGGFNIEFNPEELYALPELPAKYTELNAQLNAILEDGAEYAAPAAGTNIQPVQLTDLDGDGQQEAVAFFRKAEDEKPLKIYIFSAKGDRYEQSAVIEGSGASVYSVVYTDLDGDGRTELIVGWRVNAELQALSVYALDPAGPQELLRSVSYVRYASVDLDGDGLQELVVFHVGEEGGGVADYYDWQEGGTLQSVSASIPGPDLRHHGGAEPGAGGVRDPAGRPASGVRHGRHHPGVRRVGGGGGHGHSGRPGTGAGQRGPFQHHGRHQRGERLPGALSHGYQRGRRH